MGEAAQNPTEMFEIVDWRRDLRTSKKSMLVVIRNSTNNTLYRTSYACVHGEFRCFPPEVILPHSEVLFGTESRSILVGTEGRVSYRVRSEYCDNLREKIKKFEKNNPAEKIPTEMQSEFQFWWCNPYWGVIKYCSSSAPIPYRIDYKANTAARRKRDHDVLFVVSDLSNVATNIPEYADTDMGKETANAYLDETPWLEACLGVGRAMIIRLKNNVMYSLKRTSYDLKFGKWAKIPREKFNVGDINEFAVRCISSLGGIEGSVTYTEEATGYEYTVSFSSMPTMVANVSIKHPLCRTAEKQTFPNTFSKSIAEIEITFNDNEPRRFYSNAVDEPDAILAKRSSTGSNHESNSPLRELVITPERLDPPKPVISPDFKDELNSDSDEENESEASLYWRGSYNY